MKPAVSSIQQIVIIKFRCSVPKLSYKTTSQISFFAEPLIFVL